MNARSERFPLVDLARAVAAVAVLALSTTFFAGLLTEGALAGPLVEHLDAGVSVFFMASGFLLYRPFVQLRFAGERPLFAPYAWRLALWTLPAWWVAVTLALVLLGTGGADLGSVASHYALVQVYGDGQALPGLAHGWAVAVEVSFYAFVPAFAWATAALARRTGAGWRTDLLGLGALVAASVAFKALALSGAPPGGDAGGWHVTLPTYLDQYALGMLLAVVSVRLPSGSRLPARLALVKRLPGLSWAAALVLLAAAGLVGVFSAQPIVPDADGAGFLARHLLNAAVALLLLAPAALGAPGGGVLRGRRTGRVLLGAGALAYGIYLFQLPALAALDRLDFDPREAGFTAYGWYAVAAAATLALATACWLAVQRPAQRVASGDGRAGGRSRLDPMPAASDDRDGRPDAEPSEAPSPSRLARGRSRAGGPRRS